MMVHGVKAVAALVAGCCCLTDSAGAQIIAQYLADLSSDQVVPPVESSGVAGVAMVWDHGGPCDDTSRTLEFCLNFGFLIGTPIAVDLFVGVPEANGQFYATVLSDIPDDLCVEITADWPPCSLWQSDSLYLVLRTDRFPEGEVRGQLIYEEPRPTIRQSWGTTKAIWRPLDK